MITVNPDWKHKTGEYLLHLGIGMLLVSVLFGVFGYTKTSRIAVSLFVLVVMIASGVLTYFSPRVNK